MVLLAVLVAASAAAEQRRFAIVAGNNAGSGELPALRYAETDASKMARVLVELGDVAADDVLLLQGRGADALEQAFGLVRERVLAARPAQALVFFYFSGHSDGEGIELGSELVSYVQLRAMLEGTGADVRVSVVDACKSGAGLRQRGGRPAEAFPIRIVDALAARGEVFISSSEADEAAHESREVMGGLFTHHFISGLRGAADVDGDKRVTLFEAYRHAYERTLAATELSGTGQHATFDYRMSGRGELVLTSLAAATASIVLPEGAQRAVVIDVARDQVVAEVSVAAPRVLALSPGRYALKVTKDAQTKSTRFTLESGARWAVQWAELQAPKAPVQLAAER